MKHWTTPGATDIWYYECEDGDGAKKVPEKPGSCPWSILSDPKSEWMANTGTAWLGKEGLQLVTSTAKSKHKRQSDTFGYTIDLGVISAKHYDLSKKPPGTVLEARAQVWRRSLHQGEGPYTPQEIETYKDSYGFSEMALYDEETGLIYSHVITDDKLCAVVKQLSLQDNVAYPISHQFIQFRTRFQCSLAISIHTDPMKVVWLVDGKVARTFDPTDHFTTNEKSAHAYHKVKLLFNHSHDNSVECPPEESMHAHMIVSGAEMFTFAQADRSAKPQDIEKVHPSPSHDSVAGSSDWLVIPDHLIIRWDEVASVYKDGTTNTILCVKRNGAEIRIRFDDEEQATLAMRSFVPPKPK